MLKLKLQYFDHLKRRTDSLEKTLMLGKIESGGEGDNRGWDGWMASPTQWTWVWASSGSWWWTGKPVHRIAKSWTWVSERTELNWRMRTEVREVKNCSGPVHPCCLGPGLVLGWSMDHCLQLCSGRKEGMGRWGTGDSVKGRRGPTTGHKETWMDKSCECSPRLWAAANAGPVGRGGADGGVRRQEAGEVGVEGWAQSGLPELGPCPAMGSLWPKPWSGELSYPLSSQLSPLARTCQGFRVSPGLHPKFLASNAQILGASLPLSPDLSIVSSLP